MNRKIGDEIRDIVQDAINTRDFRQLNKNISDTVNSALDEVRRTLFDQGDRQNWHKPDIDIHVNTPQDNDAGTDSFTNHSGQAYRNNQSDNRNYRNYGRNYQNYSRNYRNASQAYQNANQGYRNQRQSCSYSAGSNQNMARPQTSVDRSRSFPVVPVGKVSGILLTVFGSIGFGISGLAMITLCIIGQITTNIAFFGTIALYLLPLFFINLILMLKGSRIRARLRRFRRYIVIFQNHGYYTLKELSEHLNMSKKALVKDLRRMISIGMFPEGHIDKQETCIILNRECYLKYLELQKSIQQQKVGAQDEGINDQGSDGQSSSASSTADGLDEETRAVIESGRSYIREIKEANDDIPGEEISKKLFYLEELLNKIFNYVEQHPNELPQIQKFMSYYLPTTLKLVKAYRDFDKETVQGENITSAKKEIDLTLDTINQAFEKLYDSFFMNAAMDISTDISVLETLLAQEGLTKKDFNSNHTMGGLNNG